MATASQLRALRKKYHLGEFKRNRKINKVATSKNIMARRSRSRGIKRSYSRKKGFTSGVVGAVIGVVGYVIFDAVIKPYLPLGGVVLAVAEVALGAYLMSSKRGFLKNIGLAMLFLNGYALVRNIMPSISSIIPSIGATA